MSHTILRAFVAALLGLGVARASQAEEPVYTEGPVVATTFVRVKPGGLDPYLKFLATDWKAVNEALKKDGIVLSYRVVSSSAANRDDWDLMLEVEHKNMAALDGFDARGRAAIERIASSMAKADEQATERGEIREVLGAKIGRELILR